MLGHDMMVPLRFRTLSRAACGALVCGLAALPLQDPQLQDPQPQDPQPQDPQPQVPLPQNPGGLDPREMAEATARTLQLAQPGPQHQKLAKLVGEYSVEMTLMPPGGESTQSTGRARAQPLLGGRYVLVELTVPVQAVQVDAIYIFGFDH